MQTVETIIQTPHAAVHVRQSFGEGLPIVMLHGSGAAGIVFDRQFESALASAHRLIAIDLPGHGLSADADDPAATYTISGLAETVAAVLDRLKVGHTMLFGWSLGGHVAIEVASFHSSVAGLMLTGTPPLSNGPLGLLRAFQTSWDLFLASKQIFSERDIIRFGELCFADSGTPAFLEAIGRSDGRLRAHFLKSMLRGDGVDQKQFVETSDLPVAIINGALDPFIRLGYLNGIAYARLWRDRCHLIPGTGHAPFWHAHELYNPLIAAFAADLCRDIDARQRRAMRVA